MMPPSRRRCLLLLLLLLLLLHHPLQKLPPLNKCVVRTRPLQSLPLLSAGDARTCSQTVLCTTARLVPRALCCHRVPPAPLPHAALPLRCAYRAAAQAGNAAARLDNSAQSAQERPRAGARIPRAAALRRSGADRRIIERKSSRGFFVCRVFDCVASAIAGPCGWGIGSQSCLHHGVGSAQCNLVSSL